MSKHSAKEIIQPSLILLAIVLITTFLLAYTNSITAPVIAERQAEAEFAALSLVMPEAESFSDPLTMTVEDGDDSGLDAGEYTYYDALDASGERIGVVATGTALGYEAPVIFMVGVGDDGLITGIETLQLQETPSIGMRAGDPEWLAQFVDKTGPLEISSAGGDTQVEGLSGATVTANAVVASVNQVLNIANTAYHGQLFSPASGPSSSEVLEAVLPNAASFSERMLVSITDGQHDLVPAGDYHYYLAYDDAGEVMAAIAVTEGDGFAGTVELMTAVNADLTLAGMNPLSHGETPGYGAVIEDEEYQESLVGLQGPVTAGENLDMISQSTFTTRGVEEAVNKAVGLADLVLNEGVEGVEDPDTDTPDPGTDGPRFDYIPEDEDLTAATPDSYTLGASKVVSLADGDVEGVEAGDYLFYELLNDADEVTAIAIVTVGKGFAGDMAMLTAVDESNMILKTTFIEMNETDGYGKVADDAEWLSQFEGIEGSLTVGDNFDGISGSTRTTDGLTDAVNQAVAISDHLFAGGALADTEEVDPTAQPEPQEPTEPDTTDPTDPDGSSSPTPDDSDSWSGPTPEDVGSGSEWPDADGGATPDVDGTEPDEGPGDEEAPARGASQAEVEDALDALLPDAPDSYAALTTTFAEGEAGDAPADTYIYYEFDDGSFAVLTWTQSFAGPIEVLTDMDADQVILGVQVMTINDTPNLGTLVAEEDYLDLFAGQTGPLTSVKADAGDQEVEAVSGATVSSDAVVEAVNFAFDLQSTIQGGGN